MRDFGLGDDDLLGHTRQQVAAFYLVFPPGLGQVGEGSADAVLYTFGGGLADEQVVLVSDVELDV